MRAQAYMSNTIFLDLDRQVDRTVFVDIRNTSGQPIDVKQIVEGYLRNKGYTVVAPPPEAFYILQGNIIYFGMADPSALSVAQDSGGGTLLGAAGGALIGGVTHGSQGAIAGAVIGGLLGTGMELLAGSATRDVYYTMMTDIVISERSRQAAAVPDYKMPPDYSAAPDYTTQPQPGYNMPGYKPRSRGNTYPAYGTAPESDVSPAYTMPTDAVPGRVPPDLQYAGNNPDRTRYPTRVVAVANKVNLRWEEALPVLVEETSRSIAGAF